MDQSKPAIVVAAYNRPRSLKRLLHSLSQAFYNRPTTLVISIDKSNSNEVTGVANEFDWQHGNKTVINHKENLGLKKHILKCGGLTSVYGSIILLEDDLYVSRYFYDYASHALAVYNTDKNIAGISLYTHSLNVHSRLPFLPAKDRSDSFFLQLPSSWGQAWTMDQWNSFAEWFESPANNGDYPVNRVPANIAGWPATSWLKIFSKYMIDTNKYFAYPYISLTTNFGDAGVHFGRKFSFVQVVLQDCPIDYQFQELNNSQAIYDAFFELSPFIFKQKVTELAGYDFEVDLYGYKTLGQSKKPYFLTTQACTEFEKSFGLDFKPIEANVFQGNPGKEIFLVKSTHFKPGRSKHHEASLFEYFYRMPKFKELFKLVKFKIQQNM